MKYYISSYVSALTDTLIKAFGEAHVQDQKTVTEKIKRLVRHYKTHVYNEKDGTKPKKKGTLFVKKSIQMLNQKLRQMSMTVTKNPKLISIPINGLLNCGKTWSV